MQLENVSGEKLDILSQHFALTWHGWRYPDMEVSYLQTTHVAPGDAIPYSRSFPHAETGLTHAEAKVYVKGADDRRQLATASIPILATVPAEPPRATEPSVPVALGLWTNPMDVVPLWVDDKRVNWLAIGGMACNWTMQDLRVAYLDVVVLDPNGTIVEERDLRYDFRDIDRNPLPPVDPANAYAQISGTHAYFVDGLPIGNDFDPAELTIRLSCGYKLPSGRCGEAKRIVDARFVEPHALTPPVVGTWDWANATPHTDFDAHAHWRDQYSYDLGKLKAIDGSWVSYQGVPDDNASYFGYGEPVRAADDGEVVMCRFTVVNENHGTKKDGDQANVNFVVLGHGGPGSPRRTHYYHLQPKPPPSPSHPERDLQVGDVVSAGDTIGFVGNTGHTDAPHLHFTHYALDATGRARPYPFKFPGRTVFTTQAGATVSALPSQGIYVSL